MRFVKRIWRAICGLFRKKRKPVDGPLTEQFKTFYDVELLRNARVVTGLFGEHHQNQPNGGVEVKFIRHTDLAVEPKPEEDDKDA